MTIGLRVDPRTQEIIDVLIIAGGIAKNTHSHKLHSKRQVLEVSAWKSDTLAPSVDRLVR